MAKLSSIKVNSAKRDAGIWVDSDEVDGLSLKVRGFTDAYNDYRNSRMRRLAVGFGGNTEKVPSAMQREVIVDALVKHSLLDIRGLSHDDGRDVTFAEFCDLLRDSDFEQLFRAVVSAVAMSATIKDADTENASGN